MSATALRRGSSYALQQLARAFNANATSWIGLITFLVIVALALLAPLISPYDPLDQDILARLEAPSAAHWFGTDSYGRDILSRLLWGARLSLVISTVSILAAMLIGGVIGILAGYVGGRFDMVVMQVMDVLLSFPSLIMGLMVVAMLGASMGNLMIAIALTAIAPFARIARAPTILVKERDYIEACRALGYSDLRIMAVHILPNIVAEILVMGSLWLATAIRIEASLSFIGLGVRPPTATWGGMIREGFENILDSASLSAPSSGAENNHGGRCPERCPDPSGREPRHRVPRRRRLASGRARRQLCRAAQRDAGNRRRVGVRQERHRIVDH